QVSGWLDAFLIPVHFFLLLFADRSSPFWPLFCAFLGFYLRWALGAFWGCWCCSPLNYPFYAALRRGAALKGVLSRGNCVSSCYAGSRRRCWYMAALAVLLAAAVIRLVTWLGVERCLLNLLTLTLIGLMVYRVVGYPLVLKAASLLFRSPHSGGNSFFPTVSLLIYAHNAEVFLRSKLENALKLDYPAAALKIVVVSDGSTDATEAIAGEFGEIMLVAERDWRGRALMLAEAVAQLDSDIVVFSDVKTLLDAGAVRRLVRHFADPRVGAVAGRLELRNDSRNWCWSAWNMKTLVSELESRCGGIAGFERALYAVRREACVRPPRHAVREDLSLAAALLKRKQGVLFERDAVALCGMPERDMYAKEVQEIAEGLRSLRSETGVPACRDGWLFFKFASHQVLGWLDGVLLVLLGAALLLLLLTGGTAAAWAAFLLTLLLVMAGLAVAAGHSSWLRNTLPGYCALRWAVHALASLQGCRKGWRESVWEDETFC
ncbi:MAG: glycosyltransferase, partial [Deltaproteobacteria bacterium]|nr:glycosyltransferase [Deltaproteobacteria bacterium]